MLYGLRKRMQAMAEAEARGEAFWTEAFSDRVRKRVLLLYDQIATRGYFSGDGSIFDEARRLIREQDGRDDLGWPGASPYSDFHNAMSNGSDDDYASLLEALIVAVRHFEQDRPFALYDRELADGVNQIFSQERVAWKLVDGQMIELKSEELHAALVEPALRLLHEGRFTPVDAIYRKALDELSKGDGPDAITDAGTALQGLLEALGCEGDQLGDLIKSARRNKLLASHDTPLLDAVERAMHWVAADRSQSGESHHASDASRDDAWLIVHVVGAFIVRLASGGERS